MSQPPRSLWRSALPAASGLVALTLGVTLVAARGEAREAPADLASVVRAVDQLVLDRLTRAGVVPAPRSSDEEFLRRLYLDVLGTVPTPAEVEAFVADRGADKRDRRIEDLLASEAYAENWATWWFRTLTGLSPHARIPREGEGGRNLVGEGGQAFHAWLADQISRNRPYDEWVRDLLTADGRTDTNGAAGYLARWEGSANNTAGAVARHFLGVQIQCAQCHDHIYETEWKQKDFQGMAAFFALTTVRRVPEYRELQSLRQELNGGDPGTPQGKRSGKGRDGEKASEPAKGSGSEPMGGEMDGGDDGEGTMQGADAPADRRAVAQRLRELARFRNIVEIEDMRVNPRYAEQVGRRLEKAKNPELQERAALMSTTPKFWMGSEAADVPGIPRRYLLARWTTSPENPYFGRSLANRLWAAFMGRGIVQPVDDFSSATQPSHPELLDLLARDFVAHGHDLKRTMRILLATETYQRTSRWTQGAEPAAELFARAPVRPLTTEQLYFSLVRATGLETRLSRDSQREGKGIQQAIFSAFSFVFDDDEAKEEEDFAGSIPQGLFLMNGELLERAISGGKPQATDKRGRTRARIPARGGRETALEQLLREEPSDAARIDRLFLQAYGRKPSTAERREATAFVQRDGAGAGQVQAYEDLLWAILNSAEFMTNH